MTDLRITGMTSTYHHHLLLLVITIRRGTRESGIEALKTYDHRGLLTHFVPLTRNGDLSITFPSVDGGGGG